MSNCGSNPAECAADGPIPLWILAELTYACPLQCPYCSNPVNFADTRRNELNTEEWCDVLRQGRELGAVQLGLSGGEPCVRPDLEEIVACARRLGYYTNLITSTVGMDAARVRRLKQAGVDHIQVSLQGANRRTNDFFAGTECFDHKLQLAQTIRDEGIPMVLNFVLHRHNIQDVDKMLDLALMFKADSVELANCQYHGWADRNMRALLPTQDQITQAESLVQSFRSIHGGSMPIYFVVPDLYESRPRPCVNGWGSTLLSISPDGTVLPCQGARDLAGVSAPNVRAQSLEWIWSQSPLFQRFRGFDWMPEPCRSCPERARDFGGCRCQAYQLTGDAGRTDPVCAKSDDHSKVLKLLDGAPEQILEMRSTRPRLRSLTELVTSRER